MAHPDSLLPHIHRLPDAVVNRIAAGEVIQRPANAIKELLENSIDAGATQVSITVKDGGLKSLQVQDNGHGIRKDDLAILCERHTTSKLREFEDLSTISTLGFRGEALASISYVSHLTVTTMTATDTTHGWKASYTDGIFSTTGEPKPCAATPGTIIVAEDLFYNVPLRKKALKSATEEYTAVVDVVGRYAIYHAGTSITVKRQGEAKAELYTLPGLNRMEAIRAVYGPSVAKNLLPVSVSIPPPSDAKNQELSCDIEGYVTGAEYSGRRTKFILFINGRLVDCAPLKRTLEATYAALLPKSTKPFIFLDIKLPPSHVDVNIHPTKKEVAFLHQEELIEAVRLALEESLLASNATRTFTQTLLPGATLPEVQAPANGENVPGYYRPSKLVRTDAKTQTLHAFLDPRAGGGCGSQQQIVDEEAEDDNNNDAQEGEAHEVDVDMLAAAPRRRRRAVNHIQETNGGAFDLMPTAMEIADPTPGGGNTVATTTQQQHLQAPVRHKTSLANDARALSVQKLLAEAERASHKGLKDILSSPTYVGMADSLHALIQHNTRLYLLDMAVLTKDVFYQQILRRFGQSSKITIDPPPLIKDLAIIALDAEQAGRWEDSVEGGTKEEVAELLTALLLKKAAILDECFSIEITQEGRLCALPQLIEQYIPDTRGLPRFILALGQDVDWSDETICFQSLAQALSEFYKLAPEDDVAYDGAAGLEQLDEEERQRVNDMRVKREWNVQHVLLPAIRLFLAPSKERASDGSVVELTRLESLYRVFERC